MTRAQGLDVSHWDKFYHPEAALMVDFIAIKASEGEDFTDPLFKTIYNSATSHVPLIGAFHYLRSGVKVARQLARFRQSIAGTDLAFLAVDVEKYLNHVDFALAQLARDFIDGLRDTGKRILLYTNQSIYEDFFASRDEHYDLWLSWPPSPTPPDPTPDHLMPELPRNRKTWSVWQNKFNAKGSTYGTGLPGVDHDVFNGTLKEMRAFCASRPDEPPGTVPDQEHGGAVTFPSFARVRHDAPRSRAADPIWQKHNGHHKQTPETQRGTIDSGHEKHLPPAWMQRENDLNGTTYPGHKANPRAAKYQNTRESGIFNSGVGRLMAISMGGNLVSAIQARHKAGGTQVLIETYNTKDEPPPIQSDNFLIKPWLNHQWVITDHRAGPVLPPPGKVHWALAFPEQVWFDLDKLELFQALPVSVTLSRYMLANRLALRVRSRPDIAADNIVGLIQPGTELTITEYACRGSNVWGLITHELQTAYIALCIGGSEGYPQAPSFYPTTWRMETAPPPA